MIRKYFFHIIIFFFTKSLSGQENDFKIITQDAVNFWKAVDSLKAGSDTTQLFQTLVIDKASEEFKVFISKWHIKASHYSYQVKNYPQFYKTLRQYTIQLLAAEKKIREIVTRFRVLYRGFKPADICIAFGNFSTGGNIEITGDRKLVYIGLEYHGLDTNTFIKELPVSIQDYVSRSNFFRTIIHELVHIQHKTHGKKTIQALHGNLLVNRILSEGIPDFISQLIVNSGNNGNYYTYGLEHEQHLKQQLSKDLWTNGNGNWFGGNDSLFKTQPRDLGYFMGAQIARNFYTFNKPKNGDLRNLIEIKNAEQFIRESKYFE